MDSTRPPERPWWMTGLALFCALTVPFLVYRDFALDHVRDVEVWFGFEVRGAAALATAPLHYLIFAVGAWGFWTQQPWILPAAAAYESYVALSHLVWNQVSPNGYGLVSGIAQTIAFFLPAILLWTAYLRSSER